MDIVAPIIQAQLKPQMMVMMVVMIMIIIFLNIFVWFDCMYKHVKTLGWLPWLK